ncbi:SRPBCC family protein [Peterkaempfera bronchialis]|uniref:SRPBCC family protein n=1 Tax=Peterkaempfera bronchialis TaxID=2126346 RepID=UPI0013B37C87|nr:SRPBCC family protein [Peterkaempfera bronchialis]
MKDIDRTAPVVVELETQVHATPATLWRLHTDVDNWPTWNPGIDKAALRGDFAEGSRFDWETSGLSIGSTIAEVVPLRRTVWGGPAHGIEGIHVWTFSPTEDGTRVISQESWSGPPIEANPDGMRAALEASIHAWLDALKAAAEQV